MSALFCSRILARPAALQRMVQTPLAFNPAMASPVVLALRPFSGSSLRRADESQQPPKSPLTAPAELSTTSSEPSAPVDTSASTSAETPKPSSTSASSALSSPLAHLYPSAQDKEASKPKTPELRQLSNSLFAATGKANSTNVQEADAPLTDAKANEDDSVEPYHFHVYSHKHNTHITVTRPNRNPIISMSCGNIGIRKSRRKNYDAAYQLTAYVLERLYHEGWQEKINNLEVVLKGFGAGREAATKVLLGQEGKLLSDKIIRVADATTIKFGGTRSKNPRRI
ncbi:hypothetical protein BROUX41_005622 [Berkeleyomyces rouxiae]|uniref:uncharacterized protein n=1 Tax=Berkeleyomyces rouxiae TaxID=2035830 RepID=UPI003B77E99A